MSTILWWAAKTAPSTCHVVMEGAFTAMVLPAPLPEHSQETEAACQGPPSTECQINIAHSLPSATQIQHLISRCLRFHSCPVILFFFSACQLCLQRSLNINRAHMQEKQIIFSSSFFSPSLLFNMFLRVREFVYSQSSWRELKTTPHPTMFSF